MIIQENQIKMVKKIFNNLADNQNNKGKIRTQKQKAKWKKMINSRKMNISMKINMIRAWMKKKINRKAL